MSILDKAEELTHAAIELLKKAIRIIGQLKRIVKICRMAK